MHHFFVSPEQIEPGRIPVRGLDVNHIKNVLRMKPGEQAEISDGIGRRYLCELDRFESERAIFRIVTSLEGDTELTSKLYLFQGLPKADKMEMIIQKAVELGAYEIIPVSTKRCVVKLDEKKAEKKVTRWNAISQGGAKQSGRSRIPKVTDVVSFSEALDKAKDLDVVLIPYEKAEGMNDTRNVINGIQKGQSVGIFIGPEGGFSEEEIIQAKESGAVPITLGRRILRTETAGLSVLSILMYHLE